MSAGATMDFFGHQAAARRTTRRLVLWFALAVLGIVAAVYAAAATLLASVGDHHWWQPGLFAAVAAAVLLLVAVATAFKTAQLRSGGPAVATMLGGTEVTAATRDERLRQYVNIVEEMSIASGVPVPRIYVLEQQAGINAFAAGWGTRDAAIAVTRGALEQLDRDQLQGVVAHEFSHVFHGDMRINIRLMGVLFGIVCIATVGEILLRTMGRSRVRSNKNGTAGIAMFGVALLIIGWIGTFFAGLIRAAVSRQREFLADASAVAYTRNPYGIGMALARIGRLGSRIDDAHAREASHMFFADGLARALGSLGATHPPVALRVERILPGFSKAQQRAGNGEAAIEAMRAAAPPAAVGFAGPAAAPGSAADPKSRRQPPAADTTVRSRDLTALVGTLGQEHVQRAQALLAELPLDVLAAARAVERAPALALALLLEADDPAQATVLDRANPTLAHEARSLAAALRGLDRTARLPLLELTIPALRRLPAAAVEALHRDLDALALADGGMSTFEFALLHVVRRHVPRTPTAAAPGQRELSLTSALEQVRLVLSLIAHAGTGDAATAFAHGLRSLGPGMPSLTLAPRAECRFAAVEQAATRLERLNPMAKRALLAACAEVAAADGAIAANEGELLRAFGESWDCPVPPAWSPAAILRS